MFKIKSLDYLSDMGFIKHEVDYVVRGKNSNGGPCNLFTVYKGSPYIRYSKTNYITEGQLKLIHEWTKKDYIEWVDD